ncbi:MAG: DVUA0089 family protein, partial [Polyangiaceae bacterium]|nr:DVUA0089 family protein [Polyangiaceae bacterium]
LTEAGYTCTGAPSACSLTAELNCNNASDDDADGMIDCADPDCALGCDPSFGACAPGHSLFVFAGSDLPKPVGATAAVSSVAFGGAGIVAKSIVKVSIAHAYDSDLDISLDAPGAPSIDLSSGNGGSSDNYTNTIFNDTCATPITAGSAPFTGCFKPEGSLGELFGTALQGTWTLTADDTYPSADDGTVNAWSVAVCAAPATCGDGVVNAGEQCDDANADNTDACLATCISASCGDGILQAAVGEACDDGNTLAGDCCSPSCQLEPSCALEVEPNDACGQENGPLAPNPVATYYGAISPIGDEDFVSFTIGGISNVRIETFSGPVPAACVVGADTIIELHGPCGTVIADDDDDGPNACSDINPTNDAGARQLAPGTYFVRIHEYGDNAAIGDYSVQISITSLCGNGAAEPFEGCDDGGMAGGDGCSPTCTVEPGYGCSGSPSVCTFICGNGVVDAGEGCDDGGTSGGDGCSALCSVEPGFSCSGSPSVCVVSCGNGALDSGEECDDGGVASGDGCDGSCLVEID